MRILYTFLYTIYTRIVSYCVVRGWTIDGVRAFIYNVFSDVVEVAGEKYDVAVHRRTLDGVELVINGQRSTTTVTRDGDRWLVHGVKGDVELVELPRFPLEGAEGVAGGLVAPMPGNVIATYVTVGEKVEKGHLMLTLEAMKMENHITAPKAGTVAAVHVSVGDQVTNGELLIVLAEEDYEQGIQPSTNKSN